MDGSARQAAQLQQQQQAESAKAHKQQDAALAALQTCLAATEADLTAGREERSSLLQQLKDKERELATLHHRLIDKQAELDDAMARGKGLLTFQGKRCRAGGRAALLTDKERRLFWLSSLTWCTAAWWCS